MSKKKELQSSRPTPTNTGAQGKSYIQVDWEQREWIENVNNNLKKVVDFLNKFGRFISLFFHFLLIIF